MACPETPRHYRPCRLVAQPPVGVEGNATQATSHLAGPLSLPGGGGVHEPLYLVAYLAAAVAAVALVVALYRLWPRLAKAMVLETYYMPQPLSRRRSWSLRPPYTYEGVRARLRRIYERVLEAAEAQGLPVGPHMTLRELLEALGLAKALSGPLQAFYRAMYGRCGRGVCEELAREAERVEEGVQASSPSAAHG